MEILLWIIPLNHLVVYISYFSIWCLRTKLLLECFPKVIFMFFCTMELSSKLHHNLHLQWDILKNPKSLIHFIPCFNRYNYLSISNLWRTVYNSFTAIHLFPCEQSVRPLCRKGCGQYEIIYAANWQLCSCFYFQTGKKINVDWQIK